MSVNPIIEPPADTPPVSRRLPFWRFALALLFCVLPWPAAGAGLYLSESAPLAFLFYHLVCAAGAFLLRSPGLPVAHKLYPMDRRILAGSVVGANVVTVVLYLFVGAALLDRPHVLGLLEARGLPPSSYLFLFPYFAIVNPLAEEYFWRGGVYATLRHFIKGWVWPALISSVFFGAWHWLVLRLFVAPIVALLATLVIMGIGFLLTLVYERTRRLAYAIILHALAGDTPLLLLLLLVGRG